MADSAEFLKSVPTWFLIFLILFLGVVVTALVGYFIFSMKQMYNGLQATLKKLNDLIEELFDVKNIHSIRIERIEIKQEDHRKLCDERHNRERSGVEDRRIND